MQGSERESVVREWARETHAASRTEEETGLVIEKEERILTAEDTEVLGGRGEEKAHKNLQKATKMAAEGIGF